MAWGVGAHSCCLSATEAERRATAAEFLQSGAARNERLLYLVDFDRASLDGAVRALDEAGFDARPSLVGGQLEVRSAHDSYLPDGSLDGNRLKDEFRRQTEAALASGYRGLRVVGEMTWALRSGTSVAALAAYEAQVNELFVDDTLTGLCQYDRVAFPEDTLASVIPPHGLVTSTASSDDESGFTASRTGGGVRLAGEVDFGDADLLRAFLRGCTEGSTSGDFEVDIAELAFLDVAGLRALVETAQDLGSSRALVLSGARPLVRRVLALTGWEQLPNLRVRPDEPERTDATHQV